MTDNIETNKFKKPPAWLVPKVIRSSYSYEALDGWFKNENEFCRNSISKTFFFLSFFLLLFIPLDLTYSDNNPSLFYAALNRGIPALFMLFYSFWLKFKSDFWGDYSFAYHKGIALLILMLLVGLQLNYQHDFPDRSRMFPPMIMAFSIYFIRVGPFTSSIFTLVQLAIWSYYITLRPEALANDMNFQLFGIILVLLFSKNIRVEAHRFLKDLELSQKTLKLENEKRKTSENALSRFLPKQLVDDIISGSKVLDTSPKIKYITVLFVDLCDFSKLISYLSPEQNAYILNSYFTKMTNVIFSHHGILDKFMGDGIMVTFGTFDSSSPVIQARNAVNCARAMNETFRELNKEWKEKGLPETLMRVGIHHGPAIVGNFGSDLRSDYTAIGNTVNIASRIEKAAGKGEVYISDDLLHLSEENEGFIDMGYHSLKGIYKEIKLYKVQLENEMEIKGAA